MNIRNAPIRIILNLKSKTAKFEKYKVQQYERTEKKAILASNSEPLSSGCQ